MINLSPLKPRFLTALTLIVVAVLSACTVIGQQEYPRSDHSDGNRFYNRDGSDKGLADISRFLWESLWSEAEWPESVANPAAAAIPDRVTEGIRTTYINHASVYSVRYILFS